MSELRLVDACKRLNISRMDTRAPGDQNSTGDDLLISVDLVDSHHFSFEELYVLVGGGLLIDLQNVVFPDLNKDFTFLQVTISIDDSDEGARVLKHDSVLFPHEKQLVDLFGEIDG
jgi:hypothetical protein